MNLELNLEYLVKVVREDWMFDKENYPSMKRMSGKEKRLFAIEHTLKHQTKALAKAMEALERFEHGMPLDEEKLRLSVRNFLISTLRLSDLIGISPKKLADEVQQWADEKYKP